MEYADAHRPDDCRIGGRHGHLARAQRVVQDLGFRETASFLASTDGRSYQILVRADTSS
jgi:hypothetical protein